MSRLEAKHQPLQEKEAQERFSKIESVARRLMQRNPRLTFRSALEITRNCLPRVEAEIAELLQRSVKAAEPKPKGRTMLIRGNQAEYID
jgi:hypothetical protein